MTRDLLEEKEAREAAWRTNHQRQEAIRQAIQIAAQEAALKAQEERQAEEQAQRLHEAEEFEAVQASLARERQAFSYTDAALL